MSGMGGLTSMAVLGVGMVLVTFSLNLITGWSLDATCPGPTSFCDGPYWTTAVTYLPAWLFLAQIMVVLALASPYAIVRTSGR